jgi:hypothetical protein
MATASDAISNSVTNATNIIRNTASNAIDNALTMPNFTNPANTVVLNTGVLVELKAPTLPDGKFFYTAGSQTTPGLSRGTLANSSLLNNNNDLSHVCDFKFVFSDGISLSGLINPLAALTNAAKNGKMAAANAIRAAVSQLQSGFRTAIKAIIAVLCADPTGQVSLSVSVGKYYVRLINEAINKAAQVVYDVNLVLGLVQNLQQIVNWIQSLPGQIQKILKDCLTNFQTSLKQTEASAQSATNVTNLFQQAQQQATNNSSQYNGTANPSLISAITGSTSTSAIDAISSHINSTVSTAPPSQSQQQATASKP